MLNLNRLVAIVPLASVMLVYSNSVYSAPRQSDYFCYERTATGEMVNLTEMCQKIRQNTPSANSSTPSSRTNAPSDGAEASSDRVRIESQARKKKVEFSDYSYDGRMLVGTIKNRTGKPISNVAIVYEVEVREGEGRWRAVANGRVRTNNVQVAKGSKTNFSTLSMRSGDRITITDVEFN